MQTDTETNPVSKIAELIKDIRTAMLVTIDSDGRPHSRPMSTQDTEFDGAVWFLTDIESAMVREIAANPTVAVTYASPGKESYVSLSGQAEILNDRERIKRFWSAFMKAWWMARRIRGSVSSRSTLSRESTGIRPAARSRRSSRW